MASLSIAHSDLFVLQPLVCSAVDRAGAPIRDVPTTSPTHDNYGSVTVLPKRHAHDFAYQAPPLSLVCVEKIGAPGDKATAL
jgi:hypothetical protein